MTSGKERLQEGEPRSVPGFENVQELQKLQDKFSKITKLFLYCVDRYGEPLTEISGEKHGIGMLLSQIGKKYFDNIFRELSANPAEDQIVEESGIRGVRVAAQSIHIGEQAEACWIIFAVMAEDMEHTPEREAYAVTEDELYTALDFLRILSRKIIQMEDKRSRTAGEETERSGLPEGENGKPMLRMTALMEIVQQLESDAEPELVMKEILGTAGSFLGISSAQAFSVHGDTMDITAEWLAGGVVSLFDRTRNVRRLPLLKGERLTVIDSDTQLSAEEQKLLARLHVKGTVIVPLAADCGENVYMCFNECFQRKVWETQDIQFIKSVARIVKNILVRKSQKSSLQSSYAALESILNHAVSAICVRDRKDGSLLFTNQVLRRIFGAELQQDALCGLLSLAASRGVRSGGSCELYYDAKEQWYDVYCTDIRWVDGRLAELYAFYDITDKKVYQKKIEQQAYTDFLTGLYNRMCCERDLAFQIDEAKRTGRKGALLYLDLDDFKHINDGLGHQYGDTLLKSVSHSFQRISEINNNCYRMGGDEFVIIIPTECYDRLDYITEEIKGIFNKTWMLGNRNYYCTTSMGIVTYPDDGESVQELIKKADIAMYEAKKSGKNRMAFYSDTIESVSGKRLDMEKNMRDAANTGYGEFEVYYQPIIAPGRGDGDGACCGAEALIRWNSAELGFILPVDFIPLAEYLGLINPIGNHVLLEACRACKGWNDNGYPDYKVNVNLSVVQLQQPDIVEAIGSVLKETGLRPENLTLEVTENLAINDMERMKRIMGNIRALGARIALDDFGTGYSSLNHIRELPFDVIKIDQSFIRELDENSYSQAFIRMVTELATVIGVNVCVEGVETKTQYDIVKSMPVSIIQGYYFDMPMQLGAFERKYAKKICC